LLFVCSSLKFPQISRLEVEGEAFQIMYDTSARMECGMSENQTIIVINKVAGRYR
jgi:hypothetical protein